MVSLEEKDAGHAQAACQYSRARQRRRATILPSLALFVALSATAAAPELVVQRTNEFRATQGLGKLTVSPELSDAAREFARFMAKTGKYGHMADGREPAERAAARGYDYCIVAENLARVYRSRGYNAETLAEDMITGWKSSPEHRKSMLDPAVTEIGVGIAPDDQGRYFGVQLFGRPKAAAIRFSVRNEAGQSVVYRAGERRYTVAPRTERTHAVCRPVELTIDVTQPFRARPGERSTYVIVEHRGALSVRMEQVP